MVSLVDTAKRALVTLLKSLAAIYSVTVALTRDSADTEVRETERESDDVVDDDADDDDDDGP